MRRLLLISLPVLLFALAGCGDGDGKVEETESQNFRLPEGELTAEGVGHVTRGTPRVVVDLDFGRPDEKAVVPGCELLPPDAFGSAVWTYKLAGGELALTFTQDNGKLLSYRNTSPTLETEHGDSVGDRFADLQENWGDELEPLVLGTAKPSQTNGTWIVRGSSGTQLLFDIRRNRIFAISGGIIQVCE
jgi:hypothetical protein